MYETLHAHEIVSMRHADRGHEHLWKTLKQSRRLEPWARVNAGNQDCDTTVLGRFRTSRDVQTFPSDSRHCFRPEIDAKTRAGPDRCREQAPDRRDAAEAIG